MGGTTHTETEAAKKQPTETNLKYAFEKKDSDGPITTVENDKHPYCPEGFAFRTNTSETDFEKWHSQFGDGKPIEDFEFSRNVFDSEGKRWEGEGMAIFQKRP